MLLQPTLDETKSKHQKSKGWSITAGKREIIEDPMNGNKCQKNKDGEVGFGSRQEFPAGEKVDRERAKSK